MYKRQVKNVPDFDGYIVKCSVSTPIEIKCENLASGLKRKTVVKLGPMAVTVNNLLKEGGKYDLLRGTGLKSVSYTHLYSDRD